MNGQRYRSANAYYGGQYSPMNIYGGNRQSSEIISMYNPESEAQFLQATTAHQQRFDAASLASAQALSTIGGMDTYDAPELEKRLKATQDKINKLVQDKYSGDYGAASNEIANIIGAERANPFYKFNQQKLAAMKTHQEDQRRIGAGFMSTGSPMDVSFKDWQEGTDFSYTPIDRQDIVDNSAAMFKSIANQLMSDPKFMSTTDGKFLERKLEWGFKNIDDARDYLLNNQTGQAMVQELMSSMPELAKLDQGAVMDAIIQGAGAGIGKSTFETRVNPDYMDALEKARFAALTTPPEGSDIIPTTGLVKLQGGLSGTQMEKDIKTGIFNRLSQEDSTFKDKSYEEIAKKYPKADRLRRRQQGISMTVSPGVPIGERIEGKRFTQEDKDVIRLYEAVKQEFEKVLQDPEGTGYALQTFNLTPLAVYTGKGQKEVQTLVKTLNTEVNKNLPTEKIQGVSSQSRKLLKDYNQNADITNITAIDTPEGPKYILNLTAANKEGAREELQVEVADISLNKLITNNLLGISKNVGTTSFSDFYNYYWPAE